MSDQSTVPTEPVRTEAGTIVDQTKPVESKTPTETTTAKEPEPTEKKSVLNEPDTGSPKEYETFKVPENYVLDPEVSKEVGTLFKGMNLSQADAQKLVDFYVAKTTESAESPYKLWEDTQEKWVNEVKADPEIGSKLPQVKTAVSKMIDGIGNAKLASEFRAAMDYTGAGNN